MTLLRWAGIGLASLIVIALVGGFAFQHVAVASAFHRYAPSGRLVDIGGRKLHIDCAGSGPSVVLESGFGGWSVDWSTVQPDIARFARVCSYDRSGMGYSDRGPASSASRDGVARDLHSLLERAGVPAPYVLVGHSLGGIYVREFARRYPKDVAGLVLVDSTHEEIAKSVSHKELQRALSQIRQLRYARYLMPFGVQRLLGLSISNARDLPRSDRAMAKAIGYRSSSYFALYDEMSSLLAENNGGKLLMRPIPNVPITVIASQKNLDDPEHGTVWRRLQHELAGLTSDSRYVEAKGSGHFVQVDRPQILIDAVRDVLTRAHELKPVPQ